VWKLLTESPMLPDVQRKQLKVCGAQQLFAANVRRMRLERHLTQEQLAEGAQLHTNYISSVERGQRNISIGNIERIAHALNVPMYVLLQDAPAPVT
jgi:transcriptional regulator with XRE-family HTH domain